MSTIGTRARTLQKMDCPTSDWKRAVLGYLVWILSGRGDEVGSSISRDGRNPGGGG